MRTIDCPIVFLDFDDVITVNETYSGYDVIAPNPPSDLFERLFHLPALEVLQAIIDEHHPRFVLTTSWLRFLTKKGFETVLHRAGLGRVAMHEHWAAPEDRGKTRCHAIERWLVAHHQGEAFLILDDVQSGTGLSGSRLDRAARVVLCDVDVGLHCGHLATVRSALTRRVYG